MKYIEPEIGIYCFGTEAVLLSASGDNKNVTAMEYVLMDMADRQDIQHSITAVWGQGVTVNMGD